MTDDESDGEPHDVDWAARFKRIGSAHNRLMAYVYRKEKDSFIPRSTRATVVRAIFDILHGSGFEEGPPNAVKCAVLSQAVHVAIMKLIELHPDLAKEVDELLPPGRWR